MFPWRRPHLVGIGGIGMSGLARHLSARGLVVSGSDASASELTEALEREGARISTDGDAVTLPADADVVIRTSAVPAAHPQVADSSRRGLPVLLYAEALAALIADREVLGVAGTHGKTTTTAMTAAILEAAGLEPGALVGGILRERGTNVLTGRGRPFVVEACEYRRAFLSLGPRHAIVTNVSDDHLDYYGNFEGVRRGFREFIAKVPAGGTLVMPIEVAAEFADAAKDGVRVVRVGAGGDADARIDGGTLELRFPGGSVFERLGMPMPGDHNLVNASLAAAAAHMVFGVEANVIRSALESYGGVERRFDVLHDGDVAIVDDYAHHPDEIVATLSAARRRFPKRPVVAVFQPHLERRTLSLLDDFVAALQSADRAVVLHDYHVAGRDDSQHDSGIVLSQALSARGADATYAASPQRAVDAVCDHLDSGDAVIVMGAGDVRKAAVELARRIRIDTRR